MKTLSIALGMAAITLSATTASAHVALTQKSANAGSYHAAFFRIGHGCQGQATTSLTITIPSQVSVRPQPKAGWEITTAHDENGVRAVTWTGHLPDDQFDDFGLLMKLPSEAQDLPFSAIQTCGASSSRWDGHAPAYPQPVLRVLDTAEPHPATIPHGEH